MRGGSAGVALPAAAPSNRAIPTDKKDRLLMALLLPYHIVRPRPRPLPSPPPQAREGIWSCLVLQKIPPPLAGTRAPLKRSRVRAGLAQDSLLRLRGRARVGATRYSLRRLRGTREHLKRSRARLTRRSRSDPGWEAGLRRACRKRPTSSVTCPRVRVGARRWPRHNRSRIIGSPHQLGTAVPAAQ